MIININKSTQISFYVKNGTEIEEAMVHTHTYMSTVVKEKKSKSNSKTPWLIPTCYSVRRNFQVTSSPSPFLLPHRLSSFAYLPNFFCLPTIHTHTYTLSLYMYIINLHFKLMREKKNLIRETKFTHIYLL